MVPKQGGTRTELLAFHHSQTFHLRAPRPFQGHLPGSWAVVSVVGVGWSLEGTDKVLAESLPPLQTLQGKFPRKWPKPYREPKYFSTGHLGRGSGVWLPALPCPSLLLSLAFDPTALPLPSWHLGEGVALTSGGSLWAAPLLNRPLTLSPVVCGWGEEKKLQGSRKPRSKNSVPSVLWHTGQGIRLRTVSWTWGQVLSLAQLEQTPEGTTV